ncbi:inositol monophosphatase [candidate division KSB1 bacterium]|nr:inositol monophosphatase [candidate division KSB1 bacterium]
MDKKPVEIARIAALEAGKIIISATTELHTIEIENKVDFDFVTEIDKKSEAKILELIHSHFPDHSIMAEESGKNTIKSDYKWIIDPLDGTTNYIHGFPFFSISISLLKYDEIIMGVVYDPLRKELFHAEKDRGAYLNDRPIHVSLETNPARCLIGTGFPFKHKNYISDYLKSFRAVFDHVSGIRRPGSAAIDLAYVACGRLNGFWEAKLSPWDISAGILLIKEAGGIVTDFSGRDTFLTSGEMVTANPYIHNFLLSIIKPILGE